MYIYFNGEFVEQSVAKISAFDHGYLYGMGLFETLRTYNGHPFLLDDHLERLNVSLQALHIEQKWERKQALPIIKQLCDSNDLPNSSIRFNVSAGVGKIGLQTDPYNEPTVIVFQKELPTMNRRIEKEGVILKQRRNTPEISFRVKSHHFLNNIAAKREIGNDPLKEGIFLTADGHVAEGIITNIFWLRDGVLYTPSLTTGILNGITRQFVLQLATELQIPVVEGLFKKHHLLEAEEIFLTNSVQEIVPIIKIGKRKYPGLNGIVTERLIKEYNNYVNHLYSRIDLMNDE